MAEDSGLDVFERVAMLGEQIKPRSSGFVAPPVRCSSAWLTFGLSQPLPQVDFPLPLPLLLISAALPPSLPPPQPVVFRQETRAYSNHLPGIMTVPGSAPGGGRLAGDPFASAREGKEAAAAAAKIRKPPPEAWGPNDSVRLGWKGRRYHKPYYCLPRYSHHAGHLVKSPKTLLPSPP